MFPLHVILKGKAGERKTMRTGRQCIGAISRAVALVVLLLGGSQASAEKALRWQFKQGEKLQYVRTQERVTHTMSGADKVKQTMVRMTTVTLAVDQINADGSARITQSIDRLQLKQETPAGNIDYDSSADKKYEGRAAQLANSLRPLIGAEFSYKLSPLGEVSDLKIADKTRKEIEKAPAAVAQIVNEEALKLLVPTLPLPREADPAGKPWQDKIKFSEPLVGTRHLTVTYKYEGNEKKPEGEVARISTSSTFTLEPGPDAKIKVQIKDNTTKGVVHFDPVKGRLLFREDKGDFKAITTAGERTFDQQTQSTETVRLIPEKK
jgi:hypothetical protein